ncbi:MAG TPA: FliM/FliN family flagellar motor switch protein [Polyangiaceae bacterium]
MERGRLHRDPGHSVRPFDLTGRERHLRAAMQAMSRIGSRFARAGRKTLPFMARRRSRLLPQGVAIADGLATAQDLGRSVRLEVALEGNGGAWAELVINAEGLALIVEGTLGAGGGGGLTALGEDITPAARALATRIARSLAQDLVTAIREEVGLEFEIGAVKSIAPGDVTEGRNSDGLRIDCLFEGMPDSACVAVVMSAEALEEAARDHDEAPAQNGDPRVVEGMRDVPVQLVAELGCTTLGLRRVLSLKVGDVLRLPTALDDTICVRVGGVAKFAAVPVACRGQVAIEIRGRHED